MAGKGDLVGVSTVSTMRKKCDDLSTVFGRQEMLNQYFYKTINELAWLQERVASENYDA